MISVLKEEAILGNQQSVATVAKNSEEMPTTLELFSYVFCCAVQGIVGLACLALLTLVPVAMQQGISLF